MEIKNRYEFMYFVECLDGNPNGDPDAGNAPRIDPQDYRGLISDVAVKRRIRNYVQVARGGDARFNIMVQNATNINRFIAKAWEESGGDLKAKQKPKESVKNAQKWIVDNYYDVRTFGGVLSVGANAGQVRGPVQVTFARSVNPVLPMDVTITRMAVTDKVREGATSAEIEAWEAAQDEDRLRTMGRKQMIPYGLYVGRGFVSANLAKETGFDEEDLALLWDALLGMYEHDRSASKGQMTTVSPLIIFKHVGTDSDTAQRERQAVLGCAPAQRLFDLVSVKNKQGKELPRSYHDYDLRVDLKNVPAGVEAGFAVPGIGGGATIKWGSLPEEASW